MSQRASLVLSEGYGGRAWLSLTEWETYRRRVAVRYPQKTRAQVVARDGEFCSICGGDDDSGTRPIQLAHRVPFKLGVVDWGLSPDWLDGLENLCLAHRGACNDEAELKTAQIPAHLRGLGLKIDDSPALSSGLVVVTSAANGDVAKFRTGPNSEFKE